MRYFQMTLIALALFATGCLSNEDANQAIADDLDQAVAQDLDQADSMTSDGVKQGDDSPAKPTKGGIKVVADKKIPKKSAPFEIGKPRFKGDTLLLDVEYGGGCQDHVFTLYWDDRFKENVPLSASLVLIHNDNRDECEAWLSETLEFDLTLIKKSFLAGYPTNVDREVMLKITGLKDEISYKF